MASSSTSTCSALACCTSQSRRTMALTRSELSAARICACAPMSASISTPAAAASSHALVAAAGMRGVPFSAAACVCSAADAYARRAAAASLSRALLSRSEPTPASSASAKAARNASSSRERGETAFARSSLIRAAASRAAAASACLARASSSLARRRSYSSPSTSVRSCGGRFTIASIASQSAVSGGESARRSSAGNASLAWRMRLRSLVMMPISAVVVLIASSSVALSAGTSIDRSGPVSSDSSLACAASASASFASARRTSPGRFSLSASSMESSGMLAHVSTVLSAFRRTFRSTASGGNSEILASSSCAFFRAVEAWTAFTIESRCLTCRTSTLESNLSPSLRPRSRLLASTSDGSRRSEASSSSLMAFLERGVKGTSDIYKGVQ
eukprot:6204791-Pleurochrysis_carterae.AAC.2